jgi:magnesium transporter
MITIYRRTARDDALRTLEEPKAGSWVHVVEPSAQELDTLADQYLLDRDLLEDATDIYETPRVEADGQTVYVFTRYCYAEGKEIATEPLLIIHSPEVLLTVMRATTPVLDRLISGHVEVITTQKTKTMLQLLAEVNGSYQAQLKKISRQLLSMRAQLRRQDIDNRIFVQYIDMEEDLNEFLTALEPQAAMLSALLSGKYLKLYENDRDLVEDLTLSHKELIGLTNSRVQTISNTREALSTIATNNLNKIFKRLTSIGIFLSIPTITASIYGMNVPIPHQESQYTFWFILLGIGTATLCAIYFFDKKKWL